MRSLRMRMKFEVTDDGFLKPSKEVVQDYIKAFAILKKCADHNIRNGILENV